jgi:S1-C subfamily serine protease
VGTQIWVAGYPRGNKLTVRSGTVSGYLNGARFGEPGRILEISPIVRHGNSGGPVFDSNGRVVGVVFAFERANDDGLAIPASTVTDFVANPGVVSSGTCTP